MTNTLARGERMRSALVTNVLVMETNVLKARVQTSAPHSYTCIATSDFQAELSKPVHAVSRSFILTTKHRIGPARRSTPPPSRRAPPALLHAPSSAPGPARGAARGLELALEPRSEAGASNRRLFSWNKRIHEIPNENGFKRLTLKQTIQ